MQARIKKGDMVLVLSGKDKGKKSKVMVVFPKENKATVEKINVTKKHQKPNRNFPGGIVDKVNKMNMSKLMVVCPHCSKATRLAKKDGLRTCSKCGETVDKGK